MFELVVEPSKSASMQRTIGTNLGQALRLEGKRVRICVDEVIFLLFHRSILCIL